MTPEDRQTFMHHMRTPIFACVALLLMLGCNVVLGAWLPFRRAWIIEAVIAVCMVVTVLLFSMDVGEEPPLHRFYAALGFCWVFILFSITMIDYLTR
ncbi:hypothetical protein [Rhodopila sp.]|uniref:hypothetical protein n=1 Tax=Rhodopila sp. TaxID=2480087 RepID=UPI003D0FA126